MPPYIPRPLAAVGASGVLQVVGAGGLPFAATRRAADVGLLVLTILIMPVHVYKLLRPELFEVPYWLLVLRLRVQLALLASITWSTCPRTAPEAS